MDPFWTKNRNITVIGARWSSLSDLYQEQVLALMPLADQPYHVPPLETLHDIERIVGEMMTLEEGAGATSTTKTTTNNNEFFQQQCSSIPLGSLEGKYVIGVFEDALLEQVYCMLVTTSSDYPWGTVVIHPPSDRTSKLSIGSPHPLYDRNTAEQAIAVFQGLNARTLVISGAYRYASNQTSCQGDSFHISDAAHATQHGFHAASVAIWKHFQHQKEQQQQQQVSSLDHTTIQFHGMGSSTCPGVDAYLTHGMSTLPSSTSSSHHKLLSLRKHITKTFSKIHSDTFILLPPVTLDSSSPPSLSSSSESESKSLSCSMSGSTNVQGRLWNGVPSDQVCSMSAKSVSGHFVHLEQHPWIRDPQYLDLWVHAIRSAYNEFSNLPPASSSSSSSSDDRIVYHRKRDYQDEIEG